MPIDIAALRINGKTASVDVRAALTTLTVSSTIDGASTCRLGLSDARRALVRSSLFTRRAVLTLDGRLFELVAPEKQVDDLDLVFEDALVADLRRARGPLRRGAGVATDAFARLLVPAYAKVVAERRLAPAGLARGADEAGESSWEALVRIAGDRQWRVFTVGTTLYLGSDDFLLKRAKPLTVREHVGPVDNIDFTADAGRPASTATVTARMSRWAVPPGHPVTVAGLGIANGLWLVETVEQDAFAELGTITLTRREAALPEPKPEPRDDGKPTTGSTPTVAGTVTAGPVSAGGFSWPLTGRITSPFGPRGGRTHAGLDIAVPIGTPVRAVKAGTVQSAGAASGYGIAVYLEHGGGESTRYGHLSKPLVRAGQQVASGEQIALSGNSGRSTGPHLHLEIRRNGRAVDPLPLLPARR